MFKARVSKPCTHCGVMIEKGSTSGFTWDRTKSGFIHSQCIVDRRLAPKPVAVSVETVPNGNGNGNGHSKESALISALQALIVSPQINEAEIRRIAADEASKVSSNRSIEIKIADTPTIKLPLAHRDLPTLLKLMSIFNTSGHRLNVYMYGEKGSGKSSAAHQASQVLKLGRGFGYISLNPQTPESRLLGYMHAGGEYVASEFFKCYTEGGIFCLDEIDHAGPALVTSLNSLLENGHGAFPHGVFPRHKDFVCVCTANTTGRGGNIRYADRRALDSAFLERFVFLEWAYDNDLTKAIVTAVLGDNAPEFMSWMRKEADDHEARHPSELVSPRAFIQGSVLEKAGMSRNQIHSMVVTRGI